MKDSIIHKIPKDSVAGLSLYRLGTFKNSSFEMVELTNTKKYPSHKHNNSRATFYIIFGEGKIILNRKEIEYKKGFIYHIRKGLWHGFKPKTTTLFLSIQTPPIKNRKTGKEDIEF